MTLETAFDVAMILPLPVSPARGAGAVEFINLEDYREFFAHVRRCFPAPEGTRSRAVAVAGAATGYLKVERIGAFDASFVPSISDFDRIDPRFRLNEDVWNSLPRYADYGFAVFQLRSGNAEVHPMALRFDSRAPDSIFFPTVHIHDGSVAAHANFDHVLYAQGVRDPGAAWTTGTVLPAEVMDFGNRVVSDRTRGIVAPSSPVLRRIIVGRHENSDVWADCAG